MLVGLLGGLLAVQGPSKFSFWRLTSRQKGLWEVFYFVSAVILGLLDVLGTVSEATWMQVSDFLFSWTDFGCFFG